MEFDFYGLLTQEQQQLAARSTQRLDFAKGQVVHRHGDACVGIILVTKGSLRFSVLSEEGREITLFQADPGGLLRPLGGLRPPQSGPGEPGHGRVRRPGGRVARRNACPAHGGEQGP